MDPRGLDLSIKSQFLDTEGPRTGREAYSLNVGKP